jgi:hypothetical protein
MSFCGLTPKWDPLVVNWITTLTAWERGVRLVWVAARHSTKLRNTSVPNIQPKKPGCLGELRKSHSRVVVALSRAVSKIATGGAVG